jgi:anti-anti-sigma factor
MSPGDLIATSVEHRDGVVVLVVEGEVDAGTAPVLTAAIDDVLVEEPSALVIDLSAVRFLASAGLQVLVLTSEKVRGRAAFAVVASGPVTTRPIRLTTLDSTFSVHETLDDALVAVSKNIQDLG